MRRGLVIPAIIVLTLTLLAGVVVTAALISTNAQAENTPPEAPEPVASTSAVPVPVVPRSIQPEPESSVSTDQQPPQPDAPDASDVPKVSDRGQYAIPKKSQPVYPNLGSRLDQLVVRVEAEEISAEEAVRETAMHEGDLVAVTIRLSGNVDEVAKFLEENGGSPRNTGESTIEAYVPVELLGQLSQQPGVLRVREIIPPQPENSP